MEEIAVPAKIEDVVEETTEQRFSLLVLNEEKSVQIEAMIVEEKEPEILEQIDLSIDALSNVLNPDGFNIGANLGESAGAGIKDHIHFHVVPRWKGDTNFMPVLGNTKVMVEGLEDSWEELKPLFEGEKHV